MTIKAREVMLKTGELATLRTARRKDAVEFLVLLRKWEEETDFLLRSAEDPIFTLREEEAFLENYRRDPKRAMVAAIIDEEIVGSFNIFPRKEIKKSAHRAVFGISLLKKAWGKGLGESMTLLAIELAKEMGYLQLELEVIRENSTAISLYKKVGFVECGRWPGAVCQPGGMYTDELLMVKDLRRHP